VVAVQHLKRVRDPYESIHLKRFNDLSNNVDDIRFRLHVLPHPCVSVVAIIEQRVFTRVQNEEKTTISIPVFQNSRPKINAFEAFKRPNFHLQIPCCRQ
jgi:hypothetical protein